MYLHIFNEQLRIQQYYRGENEFAEISNDAFSKCGTGPFSLPLGLLNTAELFDSFSDHFIKLTFLLIL